MVVEFTDEQIEALLDEEQDVMLTTVDNPYNPFDDFDKWKAFDEEQNYFTCSYLARIAQTGNELSEKDEELMIRMAIEEIIRENVLGIYKKVYR